MICTASILFCLNIFSRARAWAKYCWPNQDWTSEESLLSVYNSNKVLCGRHFSSTQFYDDHRQKLSKFAVPDSDTVVALLGEKENVFQQVHYIFMIEFFNNNTVIKFCAIILCK
jgi:hypothetical protein